MMRHQGMNRNHSKPPRLHVPVHWGGALFAAILALFFILSCNSEPPTTPEQEENPKATILSRLTASPKRIGLGGSSRISAIVIDEYANPLPGRLVTFSTSVGSITPSDTTNASGIAEAIYIAPQIAGTAVIYANLAGQIDSIAIAIDGQITQNLQLLPDTTSLLANGFSRTKIHVRAWNADQQPIVGLQVNLGTTSGMLTPAVVTGEDGTATATLVSVASKTDQLATIQAQAGESEAFAQVLFRGVTFWLEVSPLSLIADGRSTARVRAILKETSALVAVPGAPIRFGASLGTVPHTVDTDASGVAETALTSSTEIGVALLVASYGDDISDTVRVTMGESIPTYLNLSVNPGVLMADAQSMAEITAVVSDAANNPVPDGTPVLFEIVSGSGTIESRKQTEAGVARSILTSSNKPDTVLIAATVGGLRDTVQVRYTVGPPAQISVVSDSASIPADGKTSTKIRVYLHDAVGNAVIDGTMVNFQASFGDISPSADTRNGMAVATFSSSLTGLAKITAYSGQVSDSTTVRLRPGPPNSILLSYDPTSVGVKDSGRNTTLSVTADVRDAKNNPVEDGTLVTFSIFASPGGGEFLSTNAPVPTLNGKAQVSFNAGIRSGTARIRAEVTDESGRSLSPPVSAVSTDVIIHAGPPYIADVNDVSTSRVSVGSNPMNVYGWHVVNDTSKIVVVVGDKYNNPVPAGTAVYFTTSGGIISTHLGYTNEEGVATVMLHTGRPMPDIPRYYNTFFDPNENHPDFSLPSNIIPGPIPDFDFGEVDNQYDGTSQNHGIARVLAVTEGVDANGNPARVWDVTNVVFSGIITTFYAEVTDTVIYPGESSTIRFTIYDINGNPIVPGSRITITTDAGKLSWKELVTGDPGKTKYSVSLVNNLDPNDPDARETATSLGIRVEGKNGTEVISTRPIQLKLF